MAAHGRVYTFGGYMQDVYISNSLDEIYNSSSRCSSPSTTQHQKQTTYASDIDGNYTTL